jgi:hypothetical protein
LSLSKEINETKFLLAALRATAAVNVRFTALVALTFSVLAVIGEVISTHLMSFSNYGLFLSTVSQSLVMPVFGLFIYFFIVRDLHKRNGPELQTTLADIRFRNYLFNFFKIFAIIFLGILVILVPFLVVAFALEIFKDFIPTNIAIVLFVIIAVVFVWVLLVLLYAVGICGVYLALSARHGMLNLYKQVFRQSFKRFLRVALFFVVACLPLALLVSLYPSVVMPSFQELNVSRLSFLAIQGGVVGTFSLYWFYLDHKTFLIAEK